MRVYIPATSALLEELQRRSVIGSPPITAFAVTPALREWYVDDDIEELEYAASHEAARACLRLLSTDSALARRRIVIAADVPDAGVEIRDDLDRGVVHIKIDVELAWCASVHADDAEAEDSVAAAVGAIDAADLGDEEAEDIVDDADGFELSWYATQEIPELLRDMTR